MMETQKLILLVSALKKADTTHEKLAYLNKTCPLQTQLHNALERLSPDEQIAIKQAAAIDQLPCSAWELSPEKIQKLAEQLTLIDRFYRELGGIAGYQMQVRKLLDCSNAPQEKLTYHPPFLIDITEMKARTKKAIDAGIAALPLLSEMLPLGGAADRLHLRDEKTGLQLPAAKLEFAGHTLLEKIFRDLAAREHLYHQQTGKLLTTPVAIMTSNEKNNHLHVQEILEHNRWFGRPKESFRTFAQPSVPIVNRSGSWQWNAPWSLLLKPGGHGALWKLAKDFGIFDWLRSIGARYTLIRQINNPLAGLDYGLLALTGLGVQKKMSFGFSSCPRLPGAAEGMNVLIEKKKEKSSLYAVSNVEYCDLQKHEFPENLPFTANTNILFANLAALETAVSRSPFPGLLLNFRNDLGRLESTMQNIADGFIEKHKNFPAKGLRKVFVTYNFRHKTISPAKKAFSAGASFNETPEKSFYDLMHAHRDLLRSCSVSLPEEKSLEETLSSFPSFSFLFHPALGPQFLEIAKKVRGGEFKGGSECVLELAHAELINLRLNGSLQIRAKDPLGQAKCTLENVRVENRGVDWDASKPFWKGNPTRKETLLIELEGRSEFVAKDLSLQGNFCFSVKDGEKMILAERSGELKIVREKLLC